MDIVFQTWAPLIDYNDLLMEYEHLEALITEEIKPSTHGKEIERWLTYSLYTLWLLSNMNELFSLIMSFVHCRCCAAYIKCKKMKKLNRDNPPPTDSVRWSSMLLERRLEANLSIYEKWKWDLDAFSFAGRRFYWLSYDFRFLLRQGILRVLLFYDCCRVIEVKTWKHTEEKKISKKRKVEREMWNLGQDIVFFWSFQV